MIVLKDGTMLGTEREAQEYAEDVCGVAPYDIDEFADMVSGGRITALESMPDINDDVKYELESSIDHYMSCLNEINNYIDEVLSKQKIMKARDKFEAIQKIINEYI